MTHRKGKKRRVRERMAKTGERYTVALHHLERRQAASDELDQAHDRMSEGFDLAPERAAELERHLAANPLDLAARTTLLSHYMMRGGDQAIQEARRAHVVWVVEHHPGAPVAGLPPALLTPAQDPAGFALVAARWREAVARRADDPAVLRHAALFLRASGPGEAVALLERARALEPDDGELASDLGRELSRAGRHDEALREATRALEAGAEDGELPPELHRFYGLGQAAAVALAAKAYTQVRAWARELLELAARFPDDWNHGNAIHEGHQLLGEVALAEGDVAAAREALLASVRTAGSPQLDSFGPRFGLARRLLARGERVAVLDYLRLSAAFWEDDRLAGWTAAIERGESPEGFGRG